MPLYPGDPATAAPLVVLDASRGPGAWARFTDQVYAELPKDMSVRFFENATRLDGVDAIHASDGLNRLLMVGRNTTPTERLENTKSLIAQVHAQGIALVRTIFGPLRAVPTHHEESTRLLDEATTTFVAIDDRTESPNPARTVRVPFAELSQRFMGYPVKQRVKGRVLALSTGVGRLDGEQLLSALTLARVPGLSLRLAGLALHFRSLDRLISSGDCDVTTRFELLSDAAMIEEITAAELVTVPEVTTLAGLHLLMMVLSCERPALVPSTPHISSLAALTGDAWVISYDGALKPETIVSTMHAVRSDARAQQPYLPDRSIRMTGRRYADVFRDASNSAKGLLHG